MTGRTFFLEDIECDEMHRYAMWTAAQIHLALDAQRSVRAKSTAPNAWRGDMTSKLAESKGQGDIRVHTMQEGINWGGDGLVTLYAIRVDGARGGGASRKLAEPVYVFAFCKEGCSRPLAMTGVRHVLYKHMPVDVVGADEDAVVTVAGVSVPSGVPCRVHQYPMTKSAMIQEVARETCPATSSLSHRER